MDKQQLQYLHGPRPSCEFVGRKERRRACVRLALGLLQMSGAVFSATLLVQTGITALALIAVATTGALTMVSVLLFGARRSKTSRVTKESNRHFLALAVFGLILAGNSVSCSSKRDLEGDFRQEVAILERKTTPPEAKVLTRSGPVRSDWSVTATWNVETTLSRAEYSKWIASQLEPEFKVVGGNDDTRLALIRHQDADTDLVECRVLPSKDKLLVQIKFSARPD